MLTKFVSQSSNRVDEIQVRAELARSATNILTEDMLKRSNLYSAEAELIIERKEQLEERAQAIFDELAAQESADQNYNKKPKFYQLRSELVNLAEEIFALYYRQDSIITEFQSLKEQQRLINKTLDDRVDLRRQMELQNEETD